MRLSKIKTLEGAFGHGLSEIYDAEKQLVKALSKMAKAAFSPKLAEGFESHLKETEAQVQRIERFAEQCGIRLESEACTAMKALFREGDEVIADIEKGPVRDVLLIACAQKGEHYEIAVYGSLIEIAKKIGLKEEAVKLLEDTLMEEKVADQKLSQIAVSNVNEDAMRRAA